MAGPAASLPRERWRLLVYLVRTLEPVMAVLGLIWLILLVVEFTRGSSPALAKANHAIWAAFILDFALEFTIAPQKRLYLRRHWLTVVALALPAARLARVVRVARLLRSLRGIRLLRTITALNRAIASLRATMQRRGFAYVLAMTCVVTLGGAAGIYAFERDLPDPAGLHDFGTALWWTAMIMTTMGSAYWPQTTEGRVLCVLLALYAFAVFGYVTATLATYFVNQDAEDSRSAIAGERPLEEIRKEIAELRELTLRSR